MSTQNTKSGKPGRKRYLENERRELIRKFHRSGMTQATFCRANGVVAVTLSKWLRARVTKGAECTPVTFAELEMPVPCASGMTVEVIYPDGRVLRLRNCAATADGAAFICRVASC